MFIFEALNNNLSLWEVKNQVQDIVLNIISKKNENNESPFIVACLKKNLAWVDFLLSLGANANEINSSQENALQLLIDKEIPLIYIYIYIFTS